MSEKLTKQEPKLKGQHKGLEDCLTYVRFHTESEDFLNIICGKYEGDVWKDGNFVQQLRTFDVETPRILAILKSEELDHKLFMKQKKSSQNEESEIECGNAASQGQPRLERQERIEDIAMILKELAGKVEKEKYAIAGRACDWDEKRNVDEQEAALPGFLEPYDSIKQRVKYCVDLISKPQMSHLRVLIDASQEKNKGFVEVVNRHLNSMEVMKNSVQWKIEEMRWKMERAEALKQETAGEVKK
ncbi:hypothetical protein K491DRAFT_738055 [Lophiostoma macrostomum CBS 122681]|uniref:Uncharacterized protein n=1 Tax=Lophiostoma macrostomum CBS 122681 TaxID=1314788 RepID=A0A6A6SPZ4_9PLEO|nr:hypothetical protein K491DRAFT_738055 [Lophiostoma macrostomum CBS 122681]